MNVAVITGAASGIGLALSIQCLEKDMTVFMIDKNKNTLETESLKLKKRYKDNAIPFCCDITQVEEVHALHDFIFSKTSYINWLFNNAGIIGNLAPLWELSMEELHKVMDVNLFGMIHIIKALMPHLMNQKQEGHIINMASMYGLCSGSLLAAYSMSKHAVLALSESLYFDLKSREQNIEVSVVFPSFTDTSLFANAGSMTNVRLQNSLHELLAHSRPASDIARHIIQEIEQKKFYILPDKEVKSYCEERTSAIVEQEKPYVNNVEKLMRKLIVRVGAAE